jgi:hypothetical protein
VCACLFCVGGVVLVIFFLTHRSHSISFTRAQGIPRYKIGFGRERDGRVGRDWLTGVGGSETTLCLTRKRVFAHVCLQVVAVSYFFLSIIATSVTMVFVHDRVPDQEKWPPLPGGGCGLVFGAAAYSSEVRPRARALADVWVVRCACVQTWCWRTFPESTTHWPCLRSSDSCCSSSSSLS